MERQYVTLEEAKLIWDAAETYGDMLYIKTLFFTGGRSTEVSSLRPRDIGDTFLVLNNLKQHKTDSLGREITPTKAVQVPTWLIVEIKKYVDFRKILPNNLIFLNPRNIPRDKKDNWITVVTAADKAGVRKLARDGTIRPAWPYTFRHGYAQATFDNSQNLLLVKEQLGHATLSTTQKYLGITKEQKKKYVEDIFGKEPI